MIHSVHIVLNIWLFSFLYYTNFFCVLLVKPSFCAEPVLFFLSSDLAGHWSQILWTVSHISSAIYLNVCIFPFNKLLFEKTQMSCRQLKPNRQEVKMEIASPHKCLHWGWNRWSGNPDIKFKALDGWKHHVSCHKWPRARLSDGEVSDVEGHWWWCGGGVNVMNFISNKVRWCIHLSDMRFVIIGGGLLGCLLILLGFEKEIKSHQISSRKHLMVWGSMPWIKGKEWHLKNGTY